MRFFKKLFLARVKGPVSFSFSVFLFSLVESLKESFSGVLLHYNSSLTERPRTQKRFQIFILPGLVEDDKTIFVDSKSGG